MSNLSCFLAGNVEKRENKKVVVSNRFKDKDGKLKMAFHIHTYADAPSGNRKACICDAELTNETIVFDL